MRYRERLDWLRVRLTRRRAWMIIAVLLVWNVTLGGVFVHQMVKDNLPTFTVVQTVVVPSALIIVAVVWLLRNSRRPPSERANP